MGLKKVVKFLMDPPCRQMAVCLMGDGCPARTKECPNLYSQSGAYGGIGMDLPKKG